MVIQYNHTGIINLPGSSVQGADGNWPEGVSEVQFETVCRAEPSKGNSYIIGQGGKRIEFSCIVYMPIPEQEIKPGTLFEVWDGERQIVNTDVKQFSKGQLNARVWL